MLRQGPEQQHAVDALVVIELIDGREQSFAGTVRGQQALLHRNAHGIRPFADAALIGQIRGVLPQPHDAKRRHNARKRFNILPNALAQGLGHGFSV